MPNKCHSNKIKSRHLATLPTTNTWHNMFIYFSTHIKHAFRSNNNVIFTKSSIFETVPIKSGPHAPKLSPKHIKQKTLLLRRTDVWHTKNAFAFFCRSYRGRRRGIIIGCVMAVTTVACNYTVNSCKCAATWNQDRKRDTDSLAKWLKVCSSEFGSKWLCVSSI